MTHRLYARTLAAGAVLGMVCLVAAGCRQAGFEESAAGAEEPKAGELPPAVVSKPTKEGLVTMIRPVVSRLGEKEPLRIALHWEGEKGPIDWKDERLVFWAETLKGTTFHVTTPDGKKHQLRAEVRPPREAAGPQSLFWQPTLFLTLSNEGLAETPLSLKSDWVSKKAPALDQPGTYRIKVTGALVGTLKQAKLSLPFESGEVTLEVGVKGHKPLAEIEDIAKKHLKEKAGVEPVKERPLLHEDKTGNRLVRFRGQEGKVWTYNAYTVVVAPDGTPGEIVTKEVGTCVARGTAIEGEDGAVLVEKVRVGDRVWGYDLEKNQSVLTTVRAVRSGGAKETVRWAGGLRVTAEHPVYASGEWKPAGLVRETDRLLDARGEPVAAGQPERLAGVVEVYDLTVDAPHNFFAGGVLVHNKSRPYWPHVDDAWYLLWPLPKQDKK